MFPIKHGYCHCGCGNRTKLAKRSRPHLGHIAGEPLKFLTGHSIFTPERLQRQSAALKGRLRTGRAMFNGRPVVYLADDHPMAVMRGKRTYVYEHRLVVAEYLGVPLPDESVVHHINGDVNDNRLENLRLFVNHSEHMKHHHRERRARAASL